MKFKEIFCCCCCFDGREESIDIGCSGYYESCSVSEIELKEASPVWEMTLENYREILNKSKYVLVQFNDRNSVNDEQLVSDWHETISIISEYNILAAEIHDRKFFERLGINEESATDGLITQLYKNGNFYAAFNHNKYDSCTETYVNFVNFALAKKTFKTKQRFPSFEESEEFFDYTK